MADDQYIPVVDSTIALSAVQAVVEIRRGYKLLVETLLAPFPVAFKHDQTKRNQMTTLLSRADTIWVLFLIHSESKYAPSHVSVSAKRLREKLLGRFLTRAALARGLAIYESGDSQSFAQRKHTVAAARLVEAGQAYGLIDFEDKPDQKQQPVVGTRKLANFLHALGDHAHWTMQATLLQPAVEQQGPLSNFREDQSDFVSPQIPLRLNRSNRITADDFALQLLQLDDVSLK